MTNPLEQRIEPELEQFIQDGTYKRLNFLDSPQAARVRMEGRGEVIILSSNNYLGLSNQPSVVAAGKTALDRFGAGTASVRFICGTFTIHRALEAACARLVATPASLWFVSAWNANEAVPATLLTQEDIDHQRSAEPCLDHRCRAAGQGHHQVPERGVPALRSGRSSGKAGRGAGSPGEDGGNRRRLLDGRRDRQAARPHRALSQAPGGTGGG